MATAFFVGLGGMVGSMGRYGMSGLVARLWPGAAFPGGTLSVNLIGCCLIGLLGSADLRNFLSSDLRALLFIGVLGGFTTFSAFAYETLLLTREGDTVRAMLNVLVSVVGCLLAVWVGSLLGRAIWNTP